MRCACVGVVVCLGVGDVRGMTVMNGNIKSGMIEKYDFVDWFLSVWTVKPLKV